MEIVRASANDIGDIANLHAISWQNTYRGILADNYLENQAFTDRLSLWCHRLLSDDQVVDVLLAKEGGRLLGFICLVENNSNNYYLIDNLHVSLDSQGQGIAKKLILSALNQVKFEDYALSLEVLVENVNAIAFYEGLGAAKRVQQKWQAPCGSLVDEYVYEWSCISSIRGLLASQLTVHTDK